MGKRRNENRALKKEDQVNLLELLRNRALESAANETLAPKARKYYRRSAAGLRRKLQKLAGK